jgi:hypothetical protein
MTLFDGAASLTIYSDAGLAAHVTTELQIVPSYVGEIGESRQAQRFEADGTPSRQFFYKNATWDLTVSADEARAFAADDDTAGFASLQVLVDQLAGKENTLAALRRAGYRTNISWYGTSGSHQGGFVLTASLMLSLGQLGCDLYGNVYSHTESDADETSAS